MTAIAKDLKEIGETVNSLYDLNTLIMEWAQKRNWYIVVNRIPKKGWLIYGLNNEGQQLYSWCGLGVIGDYFDKPTTSLNKFINTKF